MDSSNRILITLLRPDVLVVGLFILLHISIGFDEYLSNPQLLLSTLWFIASIIVIGWLFGRNSTQTPKAITLRLPSIFLTNAAGWLIWGAIVVGLGKGVVVAYIAHRSEVSPEMLRLKITTMFPPAIILPIDGLMAAAFPLALLRGVVKGNGRFKFPLRNIVLLILVLITYLSTGSRSLSFYFLWMYLYLAFSLRVYNVAYGIALLPVGLMLLGVVSYIRLINADDMSVIGWYLDQEIINMDSPIISSFRLIEFQMHDMVVRTSTIFQSIPQLLEFQYGKSLFFGFYSILPGTQTNPAILVHHEVFGVSLGRDTGYPPTTVSQLYLDFGYFGVGLGSIVYGVVLWAFYRRFLRFRTSVFGLVSYGSLLYYFVLSFYGAFETFQFFMVLVFLILIKLMASAFMLLTKSKGATKSRYSEDRCAIPPVEHSPRSSGI